MLHSHRGEGLHLVVRGPLTFSHPLTPLHSHTPSHLHLHIIYTSSLHAGSPGRRSIKFRGFSSDLTSAKVSGQLPWEQTSQSDLLQCLVLDMRPAVLVGFPPTFPALAIITCLQFACYHGSKTWAEQFLDSVTNSIQQVIQVG